MKVSRPRIPGLCASKDLEDCDVNPKDYSVRPHPDEKSASWGLWSDRLGCWFGITFKSKEQVEQTLDDLRQARGVGRDGEAEHGKTGPEV